MTQPSKEEVRVLVGVLTMYPREREALRKYAIANSRKVLDQVRWVLLQNLKNDGFLKD